MAPFHLKKIQPQSDTGRLLKLQRERLGLSLETISRQLQINKNYLEAIEESAWYNLPGEFYVTTFTKKYALALDLKWEKLKKNFEAEIKSTRGLLRDKNLNAPSKKISSLILPRLIRKFIIFLIVLSLLTYLGTQIWRVTAPPKLVVLNPMEERSIQNSPTLTITGQTDPKAKIKINSLEVSPDDTGYFSATLDLSYDLNIIKVEAKKKYSRSTIITRNVVYNKN
ncbi:MAG: helix-turn-helix domain-containing protein [Patescibacteria group bacterium]|nr:helix-turn-helix domain-containing protein [Patescibacteria group bacterium]